MGTPSGRRGFYPFAAAGSLCDGMTEIMSINTEKALADPEAVFAAPEDLATSIALTRGQRITRQGLQAFIDTLELPAGERERLKAMTPASYIGMAAELAKKA